MNVLPRVCVYVHVRARVCVVTVHFPLCVLLLLQKMRGRKKEGRGMKDIGQGSHETLDSLGGKVLRQFPLFMCARRDA